MSDHQRKKDKLRFPCYCTSCKGGLVSEKTLRRHRDRPSTLPAVSTTSSGFHQWAALNTQFIGAGPSRESSNVQFCTIGIDSGSLRAIADDDDDGMNIDEYRVPKRRRIGPDEEIAQISGIPCNNDVFEDQGGTGENSELPMVVARPMPVTDPESNFEEEQEPQVEDQDILERQQEIDNVQQLLNQAAILEQLNAPLLDSSQDENILDNNEYTSDTARLAQSRIDTVKISQQFINLISTATLDNGNLDASTIERLRNPEEGSLEEIDPDTRLSLDLFMACNNASEETYKSVRESVLRRFPDVNLLSYYSVKKLVSDMTGVVAVMDDMCVNSCLAFTGPFADLEACAMCSEPRYDPVQLARHQKKVPRQQSCTIPIGPQLQALRRSEQGAAAMQYRDHKTTEILTAYNNLDIHIEDLVYDDIFSGKDYIDLAEGLSLTSDDMTVSFSLDGAQLYQNKKSDTWIAVWIVNDYDPSTRYKKRHILPALVIPGPNKPKIIDSFTFRGFHHFSALQRENNRAGMRMWDAVKKSFILSRLLLLLVLADALGLVEIDGRVGHHGAQGCRLGCKMKGHHKPSSGHYYAAHLRPNNLPENSNHPDFDFRAKMITLSQEEYQANITRVVLSRDQNDYEKNRKLTGISKPSILSGLDKALMLPVPQCFTVDLMHLLSINLGELLIPLWRGILKCEPTDSTTTWPWAKLTGNIWIEHGKMVANATSFFPSSFHRPPRNPAEKISSGYKATEYFLYLFGLGPAFFRTILPREYWRHFCKLVRGIRIIIQRRIKISQIREAQSFIVQFVEGYENLYYQRRMDRLHFCRPCLHTLLHTSPEATRVGPGTYSTQYTVERAIGDFGQQLRSPSNPFGNLCQIALRQSQINALKAIYPELDKDADAKLPRFSRDMGNGYIFLRPRDRYCIQLNGDEKQIFDREIEVSKVRRWGRIKLPNGQVARSLFSENRRNAPNKRISRNVKIIFNGKIQFAEIQFLFLRENPGQNTEKFSPRVLVSIYGPPNADILEDSYHTVWACAYLGLQNLHIIEPSAILSVVSMQPFPSLPGDLEDLWFVVEKSGLDDVELSGYVDPINDIE